MPTLQDVEGWKGRTVVDPDGDKVGTLEEFYLDRQSGDPTWAAIRTGLFGTHTSLAPLDGASLAGNDVKLGYSKSAVKDAPRPEVEGELTRDEERRLFDHYGSANVAPTPEPEPEPAPAPTPAPTPAPALAERPRESTQVERFSEGWLIDGTLVQPRRARLRRYVITEELVLEQDGSESSRIVGKEPYPDEVDEA